MTNFNSEQSRLLHNIDIMDFVIVEMNEYLDTHPTDRDAIEYTRHYVRMKNQAMKEYAAKYGPLSIQDIDASKHDEWKWALQPWPWDTSRWASASCFAASCRRPGWRNVRPWWQARRPAAQFGQTDSNIGLSRSPWTAG